MVYPKKDTRPYGLDLSKLIEVDVVISEGRSIDTSENFKKWLLLLTLELGVVVEPTK